MPNFSLSTFSIIFSIIFSKRDCSSCVGNFKLCFSFLEIRTDVVSEGPAKGDVSVSFPYETCESLISSSMKKY